MWTLKTETETQTAFSFRILPGTIKTLGRSTGAEFIVDATRVSRLHCQERATHPKSSIRQHQRHVRQRSAGDASDAPDGDTLAIGRVAFASPHQSPASAHRERVVRLPPDVVGP